MSDPLGTIEGHLEEGATEPAPRAAGTTWVYRGPNSSTCCGLRGSALVLDRMHRFYEDDMTEIFCIPIIAALISAIASADLGSP